MMDVHAILDPARKGGVLFLDISGLGDVLMRHRCVIYDILFWI